MKILLESPIYTTEAALQAAKFGVDRLELCSSFHEGGETPGAGMLAYLKAHLQIPVFVMIRPRGGDFVYSDEELDVMAEEIRIFSSLGADGFVFGILNRDGSVNSDACGQLIETASGKPCTFHRAFDVSRNLEESLETIIKCGFHRILTSGGKNSVAEGLDQIVRLMKLADDRIIIMPGGGMKPELVEPLRKTGWLREIHASCKEFRSSESRWHNPDVQLLADGAEDTGVLTISRNKVDEYRKVLSSAVDL
jgi:copper homeostasis protein